jgi:membrane protein DedA with SNARE-associated domain
VRGSLVGVWPDVDQLLTSPWVYLAVMALIMCDVYLPMLPSGTTLVVATVYAHNGGTSEWLLLACAAVASTLGDLVAFGLAERGSDRIRRVLNRLPRLSRADARLRGTLRRHTGRTVVFARFVPAGRCVVTFGCGTDPQLPLRRFQPWSAVAAISWASYTVGLGHLNALLFHTSWFSALTAVISLVVVGTLLARSRPAAALAT